MVAALICVRRCALSVCCNCLQLAVLRCLLFNVGTMCKKTMCCEELLRAPEMHQMGMGGWGGGGGGGSAYGGTGLANTKVALKRQVP